jgi:hypothetical protein
MLQLKTHMKNTIVLLHNGRQYDSVVLPVRPRRLTTDFKLLTITEIVIETRITAAS